MAVAPKRQPRDIRADRRHSSGFEGSGFLTSQTPRATAYGDSSLLPSPSAQREERNANYRGQGCRQAVGLDDIIIRRKNISSRF